MKYLELIKLFLALLPEIIAAVSAIEKVLPEGGMGKDKLTLIKVTIESAYSLITDAAYKFDQIWPAINKLVDSVVSVFNAVGVFKKQPIFTYKTAGAIDK